MFIRNDVEGGRYYNGKLATIDRIKSDEITVLFDGSNEEFVGSFVRAHRDAVFLATKFGFIRRADDPIAASQQARAWAAHHGMLPRRCQPPSRQ